MGTGKKSTIQSGMINRMLQLDRKSGKQTKKENKKNVTGGYIADRANDRISYLINKSEKRKEEERKSTRSVFDGTPQKIDKAKDIITAPQQAPAQQVTDPETARRASWDLFDSSKRWAISDAYTGKNRQQAQVTQGPEMPASEPAQPKTAKDISRESYQTILGNIGADVTGNTKKPTAADARTNIAQPGKTTGGNLAGDILKGSAKQAGTQTGAQMPAKGAQASNNVSQDSYNKILSNITGKPADAKSQPAGGEVTMPEAEAQAPVQQPQEPVQQPAPVQQPVTRPQAQMSYSERLKQVLGEDARKEDFGAAQKAGESLLDMLKKATKQGQYIPTDDKRLRQIKAGTGTSKRQEFYNLMNGIRQEQNEENNRKYKESVAQYENWLWHTDSAELASKQDRDYKRQAVLREKQSTEDQIAAIGTESLGISNRITGYQDYMKTPQGIVRMYYDRGDLEGINATIRRYPEVFEKYDLPEYVDWMALNPLGGNLIDIIAPSVGSLDGEKRKDELKSRLKYYDQMLAELDEADAKWEPINKYETEMAGQNAAYRPEKVIKSAKGYDPNLAGNTDLRSYEGEYGVNEITNELEQAYEVAALRYKYQSEGRYDIPAVYMDDTQANTFMALMNEGRTEDAQAYYDAIKPFLNQKWSQHYTERARALAESGSGSEYTMGLGSIGMNYIAGWTGVEGVIRSLAGDKEAQDQNSKYYLAGNITNAIREQSAENTGRKFEKVFGKQGYEFGKYLNGVKFSIYDNLFNVGMAGGANGGAEAASEALTLLTMSNTATAHAFVENRNNNMDPVMASLMAIGSGLIEFGSEKMGFDAIFKPKASEFMGSAMQFAKFMAKSGAAEAGEEGVSSVANMIMDQAAATFTDHETDIERSAQDYIDRKKAESNYQYTSADVRRWRAEGRQEAWSGFWKETAMDMLSGFLSSVPMAGGRGIANIGSMNAVGADIMNSGPQTAQDSGSIFRKTTSSENVDYLINIGKSMNTDTNSYQFADKLAKRKASGKKISNFDLGRLATNLEYETSEQMGQDAKDAVVSVITGQLREQGVESGKAQALAGLVYKAKTQGINALNKREVRELSDNVPASQIYMEMTEKGDQDVTAAVSEAAQKAAKAAKTAAFSATEESREKLDAARSIISGKGGYTINEKLIGEDTLKEARKSVGTASEETINMMGGREAIGTAASTVITYTSDQKNGTDAKAGKVVGFKDGKLQVQYADGTQADVNPANVETTEGNAQGIIGYMRTNKGFMSDDVATKAMVSLDALGEEAAPKFAEDIIKINMAARLGREMPTKGISIREDIAKEIYNTAHDEYEKAQQERIEEGGELTPGQGKLHDGEVRYGTKEWTEKYKNLSKEQKDQLYIANRFAEVFGFDIKAFSADVLTDKKGRRTQKQGWQSGSGIGLNINGKIMMMDGQDIARNMLNALGHEAPHWMQKHSIEGYNELRNYALNELEKSGNYNLEQEIKKKIDLYNRFYQQTNEIDPKTKQIRQATIDDAIYEIVSDACDQMFSSKEFEQRLLAEAPKAHSAIKGFVRNMVARLKNALKGISASGSKESETIRMFGGIKAIDELARIWLGGYDNVIHKAVLQQETGIPEPATHAETVGGKTYSAEQINDSTKMLEDAKSEPKEHFSLTAPVEMRKDGMIAVHNLNVEDLLRDAQMGGFPMPSIAVLPNSATWEDYGNTSIFFGEDSVDFNDGTVYSGDAYTPTMGRYEAKSAEDALEFLRKQRARNPYQSYSAVNLFRDFRKISNIDEARAKTQESLKDRSERVANNKKLTALEKDIMQSVAEYRNRQEHTRYYTYQLETSPYNYPLAYGMLLAAEEMAGKTNLTTAEKYEILQKCYDQAMEEGLSAKVDLSKEGTEIYDKMLEFIDGAMNLPSNFIESKPNRILGFDAIKAIVMPESAGQEAIQALIDAGIDAGKIRTYKMDVKGDRTEALKNVPKNVAGTSFSVTQQQNAEYMKAVESGDVAEQNKLVKEAAMENGYTDEVYHGTDKFGFTVFNKGDKNKYIFVGYNPKIALSYTKPNGNIEKILNKGVTSGAYKLYAKAGKQLVIDAKNQPYSAITSSSVMHGYIDGELKTDYITLEELITGQHTYTTEEIANIAKRLGYDSVKIQNVYDYGGKNFKIDAKEGYGDIGIYFNPEDVKSADPVVYDDNGNVIPLSERFNKKEQDIRYSITQQQIQQEKFKTPVDKGYAEALLKGDMKEAQYYVDDVATESGYTIHAFHGTGRADRVGTVFRPERATSGPMAFFTDNREIAEGYAQNKNDTSIAYDEEYGDYHSQFRIKTKGGKTVPVGKLWNTLSFAERQKITEAAKHITLDDEAEEIIWDDEAKYGVGNFNDYERKLHGWNSIETLIDGWLDGGTLYGREGDFLKVLEMAGIKDVIWNNPDARQEKVYDTYLKIQNPFVVSEMYNKEFLEDLSRWWMEQDRSKYEKESAGADLWDKNSIDVGKWINDGVRDVEDGYTSNWTRIPDGVTAYLKEMGYDGIKDEGGKGGGAGHTVWIPFSSEQVKSAETVTYDDNGNVIPLSERFNKEEQDIRYSITQQQDTQEQELYAAADQAHENVRKLREEYKAMKPEYDAWVNKITEAEDPDSMMEEYKEWEKGYKQKYDELYDAEQAYKEAQRKYDEYIEQKNVAEEQEKIKQSGMTEADWRRNEAKKEFGYTTNFREAGYLLPDGKMLNFSGEKGKHNGHRYEDHRRIGTIYASNEIQGGAAMNAFMKDGNIRVMAETPGIDISTVSEPTSEQYNQIRNMVRQMAEEEYFSVDLTDERGYNAGNLEYEGRLNPQRVVNDIKTYFKTGEVPAENLLNRFYSLTTQHPDNMDVMVWMESVPESSLATEAEKELLRQYKGMRTALGLDDIKISELTRKIRTLEEKGELNQEEKRMLDNLKIRLQNAKTTQAIHSEKMVRATEADGFARMIRDQQRLMNDLTSGKTLEEVQESVERMEETAGRTKAEIEAQAKELAQLAKDKGVQEIQSRIHKVSLDRMAKWLRKTYVSNINKQELMDGLAGIALKLNDGQDISQDVEDLAGRIIETMPKEYGENLEKLRGLTLELGKEQVKELKATNSSLKEIRSLLAGTGIRIVQTEKSGLDRIWNEICDMVPTLDRNASDKDQLNEILDLVQSEKQNAEKGLNKKYQEELANLMEDIQSAALAVDVDMVTDPKAKKQIEKLQNIILDLSGRTEEAAQKMAEMSARMDELIAKGRKAAGWTAAMKHDLQSTIDYFDKTAKLAVKQAKQNKQDAIIQQLKDENNQKMMKANDEWRALIQRDADARRQAERNTLERKKMTVVASRLAKLLSNPTNTKNIPEVMNPLARKLVETLVNADLSDSGRKIMNVPKKNLLDIKRRLDAWNERDGVYNPDEIADENIRDIVNNDLEEIEDAIKDWNGRYNGKNKLDTLQLMGKTLERMREAVGEIYTIIQNQREISLGDRRVAIEDQAEKVRYQTFGKKKKEWIGKAGRTIAAMHKAIVSGNMTPEYFFRTLGNSGLNDLWEEYHSAENRNGLELHKAQQKIDAIAQKYGYDQWDTDKRTDIELEKGGTVSLTLGQMMSLMATWNREQTLGPEMSNHLEKGGFYAETQNIADGLLGKTTIEKKAHRVTAQDIAKIESILTEQQKNFVDEIVRFMSNDLSKLGNEASMKAYGIKMYKEKYYFPFQMWDGIKSKKSNDSGSAASRDRAFHPSFSKSRMHGANNALVIGDFMKTATDHAIGMINYATMGLANDTFQKVLNQKVTEGTNEEDLTKRNVRAVLEEAYGMEAMDYLRDLQDHMNGGAVATRKTIGDKLISLFRKNAVAGSLSVAMQQPLSYMRAALMINPKYLAGALVKDFKGSYKEMLEHSGVAVIKNMGRFDMGFGQSAREYLMPQGKQSLGRKIWEQVKDKSTFLPEIMDNATWTRIWTAVKSEQHDIHPEMDTKSDEFLDMCAVRFNDIIRRTQVYDSTLVKSRNMRSDNYLIKGMTSFMGEPTLTLNVLADAARQVKKGDKGAIGRMAGAGAVYIMGAILQAAFKGVMGAGRSPDDKKTFMENFMYKFGYNFINEINPVSQIPGYGDLIDQLKKGEVNDDALAMIGKITKAGGTGIDMLLGNAELDYRNIEDSVGQIVQLFSGVPAKNIMRDARAIYNFITQPYAKRETSEAVLKYQTIDQIMNADNMMGVLNKWMIDRKIGGYGTSTTDYYGRIYDAKKAGDTQKAMEMEEYLTSAKGVKEETVASKVKTLAQKDESSSAAETAQFMADEGMDPNSYILEQVKKGNMSAEEAEKQMLAANPDADKKEKNAIFWKVDRAKYTQETGKDASGMYYRFKDAIGEKDMDTFYEQAELILEHGGNTDDEGECVTDAFRDGKIDRDTATEMMRYVYNKDEKSDDDIWWTLDRIEYQQETGAEKVSGNYYRLYDAMDKNSADAIGNAVNTMVQHGMKKENIKTQIGKKYKQAYLEADNNGKRKIRDAMQKAYKKLGYKAEDADKTIKNWTK